jgi:hypothetical protein
VERERNSVYARRGDCAVTSFHFGEIGSHYFDTRLIVVIDYEDLYIGLIVVIDKFAR